MVSPSSSSEFKGSLSRVFLFGVVGGIIATLIQYVGATALNLPFPPEEIFRIILAPVPGSVQSVAVENLGEYAKYSAFISATAGYVILYGLIGLIVNSISSQPSLPKDYAGLLCATPSIIGFAFAYELSSSYSSLTSSLGWLTVILVLVAANLCFTGTFLWLREKEYQLTLTAPKIPVRGGNRRGFVKKAVGLTIGLVAAVVGVKFAFSIFSGQPVVGSENPIPVNPETSTITSSTPLSAYTTTIVGTSGTTTEAEAVPQVFSDPRIRDLVDSEVTDKRIFYRVDIDPVVPQLDFDSWALSITGKVSNPLTIKKDALLSMPTKDEYVTLECISNTINPSAGLISNGKWTGVPLSMLLNEAGLLPEAKYVVFSSAEGYSVGIPLDHAMHPETILAYKMNDNPLPREHGFPLRAIIPGIYGMMNAKWVTQIEVVDHVYLGYWQTRGWSNDAKIKTTSIIYYPTSTLAQTGLNSGNYGYVPLAGVAFAGDRGISKVEVSTDGGMTWNEADLKPPTSPFSWVLWAYKWIPRGKGQFQVMVKATDETGTLQDNALTDPYPNGATGYSRMTVYII